MNRRLTLAFLFSIALILTVYTASVYFVASKVYERNGSLMWPNTAASGQSVFYPWPHVPAGIYGQMLTELNQTDAQYYQYVIKSGILVVLSVLIWIAFFWRARKYYLDRQATVRAAAPTATANPRSYAHTAFPRIHNPWQLSPFFNNAFYLFRFIKRYSKLIARFDLTRRRKILAIRFHILIVLRKRKIGISNLFLIQLFFLKVQLRCLHVLLCLQLNCLREMTS